ncbi:MAG: hypothetical protein WD669_09900 [Pirellulales bacterium]
MKKCITLLVSAVFVVAISDRRAPAQGTPSQPAPLYDADPAHLWNRLHSALFVRTTSEGMSYGQDELDPLLWPNSKYLLVGGHHKYVLALLDEFLASESDKLVNDPLKRAVFQHDLWSVFDWLANPHAVYSYRPDDCTPEQRALQVRLAKIIRRLALSAEQIQPLPDNYAAAGAAKAFPTSHNPDKPDAAFLPAELFQPDGPWVLLGEHMQSAAPVHIRKTQGRSAFFVFMNVPGGRMATLAYLKELGAFPNPLMPRPIDGNRTNARVPRFNPQLPQFPVGTQLALAREMLLINDQGKIEASRLIESVQLRVFRDIPAGEAERREDRGSVPRAQDFYEFRITRKALFSGASGGLHAVAPQEVDLIPLNPHADDEFETRSSGPLERPPILQSCSVCHNRPGIHSVEAFRRGFIRLPVPPRLLPYDRSQQENAAMLHKWGDYSWGLLQGLME